VSRGPPHQKVCLVELDLTDDQHSLQDSVQGIVGRSSPMTRVRQVMTSDSGLDVPTWESLRADIGIHALTIPEKFGGLGAGQREQNAVCEVLGSSLACVPYYSTTVLSTNLLLAFGEEAESAEYLTRIAAGAITVATCHRPYREPGSEAIMAAESGGQWRVTGVCTHVIDGATADVILLTAAAPAGCSLFAVQAADPAVTRTQTPTMDLTRRQATIRFDRAPARLIGAEGQASAGVRRASVRSAIALAAEQLGGAQRCLDLAAGYAKSRVQFGRPIASFQSIKHKCANVVIEISSARVATNYAGWVADSQPGDVTLSGHLAQALASDAYLLAARENLQIHGGMGFTWDDDAHLHFKRARSMQLLEGSPAHHREELAKEIEKIAGNGVLDERYGFRLASD
jgi:alkylation response protein AidB-like acyl-CoA dehydrogenase